MFSTGTNLASKTLKNFRFLLSTDTISRKRVQKIQKKPAKMNLVPATESKTFFESVASTKNEGFRLLY